MEKKILWICMGSACHQTGVYEVLPALQELIEEYHLQDRLELKGAFCLGACARAIVLKVEDKFISDVNARNVRRKFKQEILTCIQEAATL